MQERTFTDRQSGAIDANLSKHPASQCHSGIAAEILISVTMSVTSDLLEAAQSVQSSLPLLADQRAPSLLLLLLTLLRKRKEKTINPLLLRAQGYLLGNSA